MSPRRNLKRVPLTAATTVVRVLTAESDDRCAASVAALEPDRHARMRGEAAVVPVT